MAAVAVRLALLAVGLGFGQMGLDSFARGTDIAVLQFSLAVVLLVAGSAGFTRPLYAGRPREEEASHV